MTERVYLIVDVFGDIVIAYSDAQWMKLDPGFRDKMLESGRVQVRDA